jgi:hypothetical protein
MSNDCTHTHTITSVPRNGLVTSNNDVILISGICVTSINNTPTKKSEKNKNKKKSETKPNVLGEG